MGRSPLPFSRIQTSNPTPMRRSPLLPGHLPQSLIVNIDFERPHLNVPVITLSEGDAATEDVQDYGTLHDTAPHDETLPDSRTSLIVYDPLFYNILMREDTGEMSSARTT